MLQSQTLIEVEGQQWYCSTCAGRAGGQAGGAGPGSSRPLGYRGAAGSAQEGACGSAGSCSGRQGQGEDHQQGVAADVMRRTLHQWCMERDVTYISLSMQVTQLKEELIGQRGNLLRARDYNEAISNELAVTQRQAHCRALCTYNHMHPAS